MPDHAISDDPGVQAQLDRLATLSPGADILGLDRIARLLDRLGNPHRALPPVFHMAGTNGKGSTCAMLESVALQAGYRVGLYIKPHLVHFEERCRILQRLGFKGMDLPTPEQAPMLKQYGLTPAMMTGVPRWVISKSLAEKSIGRRTQPWEAG